MANERATGDNSSHHHHHHSSSQHHSSHHHRKHKKRRMKKLFSRIITVILLLGLAIALYAWKKYQPEERIPDYEEIEITPDMFKKGKTSQATETKEQTNETKKQAESGMELPVPLTDRPETIIKHKAYTLSYNTKHNTPNWVAWVLTRERTYGKLDRQQKFWADPLLPRKNRVDFYDYKESEYDRGHMCPAGDMKWDEKAMYECFYMSNMCPQNHTLNSGSWETLETACRVWARKEGKLYIVCGPVYKPNKKHERIGISHAIDVPEGFFKAVLSLRKGQEKAIAFYYDNNAKTQHYRNTAMSVDDIEKLTGIDLFPSLNNSLEKRLESKFSIGDW